MHLFSIQSVAKRHAVLAIRNAVSVAAAATAGLAIIVATCNSAEAAVGAPAPLLGASLLGLGVLGGGFTALRNALKGRQDHDKQ